MSGPAINDNAYRGVDGGNFILLKPGALVIILLLLGALTLFYQLTRIDDPERHQQVIEQLLQVRQANAELNEQILSSRQHTYHNYDRLELVKRRLNQIVHQMLATQEWPEETRHHLLQLKEVVEQKSELTEEFKSTNAMMKNSLHYLPTAAEQAIEYEIENHQAQAEALQPHTDAIHHLLRELLSYNITSDRDFLLGIHDHVNGLSAMQHQETGNLTNPIKRFLEHTWIIINYKGELDSATSELINFPIYRLSQLFEQAYMHQYRERVASADRARLGMYLISVMLLSYIVYSLIQLNRRGRQLQSALTDLEFQKFALDQHSIVSTTDSEGTITYANAKFIDASGFNAEELLGQNHRIVKSDTHPPGFYRELWRTVMGGEVWHGEVCNRNKDGSLSWMEATIVPFLNQQGTPYQFIAIRTDITELKRTQSALFREKELAQFTLESIGGGVITTDLDGRVDFINQVAEQLTGFSQSEAHGLTLREIFPVFHEVSGEHEEDLAALCLKLNEPVSFEDHMALFSRDERQIPVRLSIAPIVNRQGLQQGVVLVFNDVGRERQLRHLLKHQATHDALTGLVNRRAFEEELQQTIDLTRGSDRRHVMLYIDLDQFKVVNDTCGHGAGDLMLQQLAGQLKKSIRETDILARLGGDEFGLLLLDTDLVYAKNVANKLLQSLSGFRFNWEEKRFGVGASIGLTSILPNGPGLAEVMSAADMACYTAKEQGRNRVHIYQSGDKETKQKRNEMQWVSRIKSAIEEERLTLFCQAILPASAISLHDALHFEVLLRMRDENENLIPPGAFIPAAERYNLMPQLDRWVVRTLFDLYSTQLTQARQGGKPLRFAINLSGSSFNDPHFLSFLRSAFEEFQVPPHAICFEITETAAIYRLDQASQFIGEFRKLGCSFSLDDFGSGLSSFGYLKNLQVDFLKIDGSFVREVVSETIDQAMIGAINQVGHTLGLKTIAEWVENREVREQLVKLGVDYMQGYHLHQPEPIEQLLFPERKRRNLAG